MKLHISYTPIDLKNHGAEVCRIANEHGWEVVDGPRSFGENPSARLESVKSCDAILVLSAHYYGISGGKALQELEWDAARDQGIGMLALVVNPKAPWPPPHIECINNPGMAPALESFHRTLRHAEEYEVFEQDPESVKVIEQGLNRIRTEMERPKQQRVFLVWDFTIIGLELMLAALKSRPPKVSR